MANLEAKNTIKLGKKPKRQMVPISRVYGGGWGPRQEGVCRECDGGGLNILFRGRNARQVAIAIANVHRRPDTERALRDRLMSRGKNCLPTVSRQFLTRNYPRPNCLLKCLPNCLSPTREGFFILFQINPAVRVIVRQVRDKNCLAAIFAPRHPSVSSGPLGNV